MPVLLFDMMDTLIEDPFYRAITRLMNEHQLRRWAALRDPEAYLEFEAGRTGEAEYFRRFFRSGVSVDDLPSPQKLKKAMMQDIRWLPGIPELLAKLKGVPLGLASNYSLWYREIFRLRADLQSHFQYLFFSCEIGHRKPSPFYYTTLQAVLEEAFPGETIIFCDDREENLRIPASLNWQIIHIERPTEAGTTIESELRRLGVLHGG